ncbi:hypothetical protein [Herbaspirillum sp. C7C8]|uniref:hypothetical protein n=1 Tax=Herbaspirillum sp. C7C8 TaxID=2736665 RepID=UPI001F527AC0|nr:hypothetical protein [Herbaspirillum sp. C7C8]MCI1005222.1 hypothetical protein [Herbaspirillum sp. C7C8]
MKRNPDLLDKIIIAMVDSPKYTLATNDIAKLLPSEQIKTVTYHLHLLMDMGHIALLGPDYRVTSAGQDHYDKVTNGYAWSSK